MDFTEIKKIEKSLISNINIASQTINTELKEVETKFTITQKLLHTLCEKSVKKYVLSDNKLIVLKNNTTYHGNQRFSYEYSFTPQYSGSLCVQCAHHSYTVDSANLKQYWAYPTSLTVLIKQGTTEVKREEFSIGGVHTDDSGLYFVYVNFDVTAGLKYTIHIIGGDGGSIVNDNQRGVGPVYICGKVVNGFFD